jgi:hypothetical protein
MRACLALTAVLIAGPLLGEENQWERVYPDEVAVVEEMPLLSIGRVSQAVGSTVAIGSRNGFIMWSKWSPGRDISFGPPLLLQLDVAFDITAISSSLDSMFVGGPSGQIAVNADMANRLPADSVSQYAETIAHGWQTRNLPTANAVHEIRIIGDVVLVLAGTSAWVSTDEGLTWRSSDQPEPFFDIEAFSGTFYATGPSPTIEPDGNHGNGAALFQSEDGLSWTVVWDMADAGYAGSCLLYLLDDGLESTQRTAPSLTQSSSTRLHVQGDFFDTILLVHNGTARLKVSTADGETWLDHFSYRIPYSPGFEQGHSPWNPLGLEPGFLYVRGHEGLSGNIRYNYEIRDNQLLFLRDQEWTTILETHPSSGAFLSASKISQWDRVTFIPNNKSVFQVTADGLSTKSLPDFGSSDPRWGYLHQQGNTYYASVYLDEGPLYVQSTDLSIWTESDYPEGNTILHLAGFPSPAIQVLEAAPDPGNQQTIYMLKEGRWDPLFSLPTNTVDVGYVPAQSAYFRSWRGGRSVHVDRISANGQLTAEASFDIPTARDYFTKLTCPDGERLILYGSTERFAVREPDGSYQEYDLAGYFGSEGDIHSITFINGWYYIAGTHCLRTKDFATYEVVDFPGSGEVIKVLAQGRKAYFFSRDSVFSQPLELGYLDSVLDKQDWHHADWLGWFQIIDEDLGDIDHLLLGKCWVKQTSELEYWIRAESLGWIWMNKDWSPWLYRLEDGHWYWLDQDGWPPRAWDDTAKEWEEL